MLKIISISLLAFISFLIADFSDLGPYEVETLSGIIEPINGGSTQYSIFQPIDPPDAPHLIIAHEFVSSHDYLANLSQHYASWGIRVATMNLLHSSLSDNSAIQDAEDLVWLSDELFGGGPVIYAGYSAGGLRSIIASAQDSDVVAFLGLDLVDFNSLSQQYAQNIDAPVYGLAGEPSTCNSEANGLGAYNQANNAKLIRVTEADHCDFQSPTSFLCGLLCDRENIEFNSDEIQALIRTLSTAFLTWRANLNPEGVSWWLSGYENYENLLNSNSISELVVSLEIFEEKVLTDKFYIYQNFPNPFNPSTQIKFEILDPSNITITIYDLSGKTIKNLINVAKRPGSYNIAWDATNNNNMKVSSGVYIYELKVGNKKKNKKMILLQ